MAVTRTSDIIEVEIGPQRLKGHFGVPADAKGIVIFAHGSGSGRLSPRNNRVAAGLCDSGLATLLLDLLTPEEEQDRENVFDIALLAARLALATSWAAEDQFARHLPIGYFGASTGAAAALLAAAQSEARVAAIVSRGGRPDLAGAELGNVVAPTLLIVGALDGPVIDFNRTAYDRLPGAKELVIVPGAGHLFEEPGKLEEVERLARRWFLTYLPREN